MTTTRRPSAEQMLTPSDDQVRTPPDAVVPLVVQTHGRMPSDSPAYAREKVLAAIRDVREPVVAARVRLTMLPDPAASCRAIAQANLDVDGTLVRAQVAAPTMHEAVDRLHDRLRTRLERIDPHWEARRGSVLRSGRSQPRPWGQDGEPAHRPERLPHTEQEPRLVRRKTFALVAESVDEAVLELESMDYAFHLFTETDTGQDCVVWRAESGNALQTHCLAGLRAARARRARRAPTVCVSDHDASHLSATEAVERLELTGEPFVFFADRQSHRGTVVYHRFDGKYGLITSPSS